MIPGNRLSSRPVRSELLHFAGFGDPLQDVEWGGVAINDASQGIQLKLWTLRYDVATRDMLLGAEDVPEIALFNRDGITQVSLAFDRNMSPVVAFTQEGQAKLYFFDDLIGDWVFWENELGDAIDPRVTHDDKRTSQNAISDVILAYARDGFLRTRQQRDRYLVEYLLLQGEEGPPAPAVGLFWVGMGENRRLHFIVDEPA